jgi:hypothetical protein
MEWILLLHGKRPDTTTTTPHRDIDYIFTYGFQSQNITILPVDYPTKSDHQGICLDISTEELFNAQYNKLSNQPPRKLTLNNSQAKQSYKKYVLQQLEEHKIWEHLLTVYNKAITPQFMDENETTLTKLDAQITEILLYGERQCAKDSKLRESWPLTLLLAGKTLSYCETKVWML